MVSTNHIVRIVCCLSFVLAACGGGGNARIPESPAKFAAKAMNFGCETKTTGDGEYVVCDEDTYIAVHDGSGSLIRCDKAGSSECQKRVEKIVK